MLGCNSLHWARNPHNWGETSSGFLPVFNTAFLVAPRHRSYCSLWSYKGNVRSSDFPPLHTFREEASCALTTQAHTRCKGSAFLTSPPKRHCAVIGCKASEEDTEVYYRLPHDSELRQAWLLRIGLSVTDKRKSIYVCGQHFAAEACQRSPL